MLPTETAQVTMENGIKLTTKSTLKMEITLVVINSMEPPNYKLLKLLEISNNTLA